LTFNDGAFASVVYSGYGHFDSDEFAGWVSELGQTKDRSRHGVARKALQCVHEPGRRSRAQEWRNYGGANVIASGARPQALHHEHFGLLVISCEKADLRPLPTGVVNLCRFRAATRAASAAASVNERR